MGAGLARFCAPFCVDKAQGLIFFLRWFFSLLRNDSPFANPVTAQNRSEYFPVGLAVSSLKQTFCSVAGLAYMRAS